MKTNHHRLLIGMLIVAVVLWITGAVTQPLFLQGIPEQQRADNAILGGIPFILTFIGIIVAFIDLIIFLAIKLNNNVSASVYNPILNVLIAGIVLGIVGMFQPFLFVLYQIGFIMLFISLIGFMVWSHITPKGAQRATEIGSVSISEVEKHSVS